MKDDNPAFTCWKTSSPLVPTALPIWNALAPAMMYSAASLQSEIPPTPTRGMSKADLRS